MATRFEVASYVESDGEEKVLSAKPEQHFNDLGLKVTVWNVKTDKGAWWVVEGERVPMNLYPPSRRILLFVRRGIFVSHGPHGATSDSRGA